MPNKDYFPRNEDALYVFLTDFKTKLAAPPAGLVLAPALQTSLVDYCDSMIAAIDYHHSQRAAAEQARKQKDATVKTKGAYFRDAIKTLKQSIGYTDAIGAGFGILSTTIVADLAHAQPVGKATRNVNGVRITYTRGGADGVFIYSRRGAETDFTRLEKINGTEYLDTRPNLGGATAERREYYLIYFKHDTAVGVQSATFSV